MERMIADQPSEVKLNPDRSLQLALAAARTAEENRGRDIVVLDMRELTPIFDYFVIATGTSRRQLHAMSEEIDHTLEDDLNDRRMGIEGYAVSRQREVFTGITQTTIDSGERDEGKNAGLVVLPI